MTTNDGRVDDADDDDDGDDDSYEVVAQARNRVALICAANLWRNWSPMQLLAMVAWIVSVAAIAPAMVVAAAR